MTAAALAQLSDQLFLAAVLLYALAMLAFAGAYAGLGHFGEFWHAMVTSNLTKVYNPAGDEAVRAAAYRDAIRREAGAADEVAVDASQDNVVVHAVRLKEEAGHGSIRREGRLKVEVPGHGRRGVDRIAADLKAHEVGDVAADESQRPA